jgi:hypothetical protein
MLQARFPSVCFKGSHTIGPRCARGHGVTPSPGVGGRNMFRGFYPMALRVSFAFQSRIMKNKSIKIRSSLSGRSLQETLLAILFLIATLSFAVADVGETRKQTRVHEKETTTRSAARPYTFDKDMPFRENEFAFDVFGSYTVADDPGLYDDAFGGGLGLNYFFSRYFGVGGEGYWWDGDSNDDVVSSFSASAILRYPIDRCRIAPSILGGVGYNFSTEDQATIHLGGGVEYRFTQRFGSFFDGRFVWTDDSNDYGLLRLGLRFVL